MTLPQQDERSEVLQQEYEHRFRSAEQYRDAVWKILCARFFAQYVDRSATVLDLGSGWGEFSRHIQASKKYAMDLNPESGRRLAGVSEFLQQDCSEPWPLEDASLDAVFTSNFLEHLPDKQAVERTLGEAFRCLKPGGKIICLGPNIKYVPGAYWDFWDHFIPITEDSLAEVLKLKRFRIAKKIARFLPYTMSSGKPPPLFTVEWYLRLPMAWRFFGKQFLVIGEKP